MPFIKQQAARPVAEDQRRRGRDCASLIAALDDVNPTARRWAARDLIACPDVSLALVSRLHGEPDRSVREVILTTLTLRGDDVAVTGLAGCLRSQDAALRNEAIEAMKQLPDQVAVIMGELLAAPDPDVRIFAINILESLRHSQVESWLVTVIDRDLHINVCATAVDLLGEVGSEAAHHALVRLRARFADDPYIQFATELALKRIAG